MRVLRFRNLAILFAALAWVLALWAFWLEPASLRNEVYALALPSWPPVCGGLRVAVLADIHTGSPFNGLDKLEKIVSLTLDSKADVVLLAGDYVIHSVIGGEFTFPEEMAKVLGHLAAPLGVYAVLGNHDWWFDALRVYRAFTSVGIRVLENQAVKLQRGECSFWLAGLSDFNEGSRDLQTAFKDVAQREAVIAFTHNPDVFPEIPSRVALTIAGHTHGGQVYIPGLGRPIIPSRYGQRFAIGHIVEEGRHLFVSSGLGTSIFPVRFLVPPEITVLRLHAKNRQS